AGASIAVLDLQSGKSTILVRGGIHATYAPSGHLVYASGGTLRAIGFDLAHLTVVGPSIPVVAQVMSMSWGTADAGLARHGTLVYVAGTAEGAGRTVVGVDGQGRETPLGAPPRAYFAPRVSPEGTRVAVGSIDTNSDLWLWDLARPTLTRLTTGGLNGPPVWTPDGRRIVYDFGANLPGLNLFSQAADGTGPPERLTESP